MGKQGTTGELAEALAAMAPNYSREQHAQAAERIAKDAQQIGGDAKHTPGPWVLDDKPAMYGCEWFVRSPRARVGICSVWKSDDSAPSFAKDHAGQANARLIAAAPDLLEACREIVEHGTDDWDARIRTIRAAIAKAEGGAK